MIGKKLTIEAFNQIKQTIQNIFDEVRTLEETKLVDSSIRIKALERRFLDMQSELLSCDLSDIPYDAYQGLILVGDVDFSNTHANIDFNILNTDSIDSITVKGCNIRNLQDLHFIFINEDSFDENVVSEYPNLFLLRTIPKEFRKKYYSFSLTIEDFCSLSDEQLQEVEQKGTRHISSDLPPQFLRAREETRTMIDMLGLVNAVTLYKENRKDYQELSNLFSKNSSQRTININFQNYWIMDSTVRSALRASDSSHLKEVMYQEVRKKILDTWSPLELEQFTLQFIEENEDIFLLHHTLPDDLREKYYHRQLTYQDLSENIEFLKDSPYTYFLKYPHEKQVIEKIGLDIFSYLLQHYKSVMDHLQAVGALESIQNYTYENIINRFPQMIALRLHEENPRYDIGSRAIVLPDWAQPLNYKIVPGYQKFDDLFTYDNHTLIANHGQQIFLYMLGSNQTERLEVIKSIIEFEKKYLFFQNYEKLYNVDFGSAISIIGINMPSDMLNSNIYSTFEEFFFDYLDKQRSHNGIPYERIFDDSVRVVYPDLFISKNCPQELQDAFYTNQITAEILQKYRDDIPELLGKRFTIPAQYAYRGIRNINHIDIDGDFSNIINQEQFLHLVATYGPFPFSIGVNGKKSSLPQEKIEKVFYEGIYQNIVSNNIIYKKLEAIPLFKSAYPQLFLEDNVPKEIQDAFYNKKINGDFIKSNPDLLKYFTNTNISFGFEDHLEFFNELYIEEEISEQNRRHLFIYGELQKIDTDMETLDIIKDYIKNHEYNEEKIAKVVKLAERAVHSNSKDIRTLSGSIIASVVDLENPEESFEKIESVFIQNNLPFFVKVYSCFQILNSNLENFDFSSTSRVAPELKEDSLPMVGLGKIPNDRRFQIIYNDLLRITYSSNNRDFQNYLRNIEFGNECYNQIVEGKFDISILTNREQRELLSFAEHLETLYRNTQVGKQQDINFDGLSLDKKIKIFGDFFSPNERYQLKDRIIRSFCFFAGITSFDQLESLTENIHRKADRRGRRYAKQLQQQPFCFEVGDFVRGIGDYSILGSSFQHGNVSKEFLTTFVGKKTKSDTTPFDIDLSYVDKEGDIFHTVADSPTGFGFGNVFIILKHDNPNINITRDKDGNLTGNSYDSMKIEVFGTKTDLGGYETHWGARTGLSFSDVDYILYKKKNRINEENPYDANGNVQYLPSDDTELDYDDLAAIKFEIARNGVYIPVIDFSGKLIYTEDEYDNLRSKMQGLSYYGMEEYTMSSSLKSEEIEQIVQTIPQIEQDNAIKRQAIDKVIGEALSSLGITLKGEIDHKLETGTAEFIDTGSTGRNTNILGKGDFDFIMRLDNSIMSDVEKLTEVKDKLLQALGEEHRNETVNGNFRFKNVYIDGLDEPIDIDISFIQKTDKMDYSSDESLRDRLRSIKEQHPEDYDFVLANIINAKEVLKEGEVYKKQQGGIGGIGIENWILQHGGSFQEAATSFLEAAQGKTLSEFQTAYPIWDFGENHYADEKGFYKYDNFISNLTEEGYTKMQWQLSNYLEKRKSKNELKAMVGENSMGQAVTHSSTVAI